MGVGWIKKGAAAVALCAFVAGCGGPQTPAERLASDDANLKPASDYQAVLDQVVPRCTESPDKIATETINARNDLLAHNIFEHDLDVLQGLADSLPSGSGQVDCASVYAAWLLLREQKS